ncbi:11700_t:CDS:2 [Dentiscutata heterogama]|uniref:11700_t:CDS:1 n=1 Tax=Dentiscutata heterogama TaxID=1316150 RepID=A0ACA9KKZ3_9GLOM|nr:11700_t:CDS:2 [Dentiscutata heterogama]
MALDGFQNWYSFIVPFSVSESLLNSRYQLLLHFGSVLINDTLYLNHGLKVKYDNEAHKSPQAMTLRTCILGKRVKIGTLITVKLGKLIIGAYLLVI